jgi:hypothetical protein
LTLSRLLFVILFHCPCLLVVDITFLDEMVRMSRVTAYHHRLKAAPHGVLDGKQSVVASLDVGSASEQASRAVSTWNSLCDPDT